LARSTTELVLGVDAGATKTHALVADGDGRVLGFGAGGAANWETAGIEGTAEALQGAVRGALESAGVGEGDLSAAGYGLAGLDWPSDEALLAGVLDELGIMSPRVIVNDAFVALRAGCTRPFGVVSSAGTGGVTAGRNRDGRTFRTMGIGFGEGNGSSDLITAALHAVAREHHRSGPATLLTPAVLESAGVASVPELFEGLTRGRLQRPEGLSRTVLELADSGDAAAAGIADAFGAGLAESAGGVARRLDMAADAFELVRSGSIQLAGCRVLDDAFRHTAANLLPAATIVSLTAPPAVGAVLMALDLLRPAPVSEAVHARLAAEATVARTALPNV
jgi:N-acetylglucosamine kinase-like BadF-type ATPase